MRKKKNSRKKTPTATPAPKPKRKPKSATAARSDRRLVAGTLGAPFGLHGELSCTPSRIGEDALASGVRVSFEDEAEVTVTAARRHHGRLLLRLDGVASPEDAKRYSGRTVYLQRADVVLARGEYLDEDLIGLRLVDADQRELGTVADVRHFPAQDCLVVEPGGGFVPLVSAFIQTIDVARGCIVADVPPGLLDDRLAEEA